VVRRVDLFAHALLLASGLLGGALWTALPDLMAVHFGPDGRPDGVLAKPVALVLAPAIGSGVVLLVRHGPDWASSATDPAVENATVLFVSVTIAALQVFVYLWNLGHRVSPTLVGGAVLLGAAVLVAYTQLRS
jgi:uncharacterized membrane protein